eukprot:TRINITY_DN17450_c0_g1_i1.p1 TRINITY_DN17450_c0_g1~~TRINITY_DN17450_c0_g1_i1.p1  ORF type:complete len:1487 (+),score=338.53 TRINITY_DN17450_c0_g1_i1:62-4522(+)
MTFHHAFVIWVGLIAATIEGCGVVPGQVADNGDVLMMGEVQATPVGRVLGKWIANGYDSCGMEAYTCYQGRGVCGNLHGVNTWVMDRSGVLVKVTLLPGRPVSLKTDYRGQVTQPMRILNPITVVITDTWGNPSVEPTAQPRTLVAECVYRGVDKNFAIFGTKELPFTNGSVTFTDLTVTGMVGFCDLNFKSEEYNPTSASGVPIEITLGEPVYIDITPSNPKDQVEFYQKNASVTVQNINYLDLRVVVTDYGHNVVSGFDLCADHNRTSIAIMNGSNACIFMTINMDNSAKEIPSTVKSYASPDDSIFSVWVPDTTGSLRVTAKLNDGHNVITKEATYNVVDRSSFQCVYPKYGAILLQEDLSSELLDSTTMDEITRTFFDLSVPPPPFVRFNISARTGQPWHFSLPAVHQYWVLMKSPFYIEIDPVLSVYFCFGFSYARVDDLAINLKQPFCGGSDGEQVVSELAILLFDLGDASGQYHKTRGAFSGTTGTAKFGNFTGFIPEKEQLSICVGDRILSAATTGYHIKCCERSTGHCKDGSSSHTMQTIVIALTTIVTTLATIAHMLWIVKCLLETYRSCPTLRSTEDIAQKAKVISVHIIAVVFPLFSVVVNREYVDHFHPLVSLWIIEVASIGFWFLACSLRLLPGTHRILKVVYDVAVMQLGFVSLWHIWAAWAWAVPAMFLETRRTLVPFTCFSTLLAHCIMKPGVISNFPVIKVTVQDSQDMLLDSLISTALFAGFLTGLVYALNSFTVVTDTQMILAVVVVLGVGVFMSWSLSGRFAAALRRTVSESAEKAGAIALDMVNKRAQGNGNDSREVREALNDLADDQKQSKMTRKQSTNFDYRKLAVLITGKEEEEERDDSALNPLIPATTTQTTDSEESKMNTYSPPALEVEKPQSPRIQPQPQLKKGILKPISSVEHSAQNSSGNLNLHANHHSMRALNRKQSTPAAALANLATDVLTDVLLTPIGTPCISPRDYERRGSNDSQSSEKYKPSHMASPRKAHSIAKLFQRTGSSYNTTSGSKRSIPPLPELPPVSTRKKKSDGSSTFKRQDSRAESVRTDRTECVTPPPGIVKQLTLTPPKSPKIDQIQKWQAEAYPPKSLGTPAHDPSPPVQLTPRENSSELQMVFDPTQQQRLPSFMEEAERLCDTATVVSTNSQAATSMSFQRQDTTGPMGLVKKMSEQLLSREDSAGTATELGMYMGQRLAEMTNGTVESTEVLSVTKGSELLRMSPTPPLSPPLSPEMETWQRPAKILFERRRTSCLSDLDGIPRVESFPMPPAEKRVVVEEKILSGSSTPLLNTLMPATEPEKLLMTFMGSFGQVNNPKANNPKQNIPSGGWVEGSNWVDGKYVPPTEQEIHRSRQNTPTGRFASHLRQMLDDAEESLTCTIQRISPSGASGSPTGASATPTGASGSPTGASGTPTGGSATPTGASGSPCSPNNDADRILDQEAILANVQNLQKPIQLYWHRPAGGVVELLPAFLE